MTDTSAAPSEHAGEILAGFRLVRVLGEGGMGRVWLAEEVQTGKRVALKELLPDLSRDRKAVERFFAEARAIENISHPGIVQIQAAFPDPTGGRHSYVMEYLEGEDLQQAMQRTILPLPRTLDIAAQLASTLAAVHEAGTIHRDVKPENVFLRVQGEQRDIVKLLDFGVAKLTGEAEDAFDVTRTSAGQLVGTPQYMSPEQLNGRDVDYRSDIYTFGLLLYEMITGRRAVKGASLGDLAVEHLTVMPPRPSRLDQLPHVIPVALEELVLCCLEKQPDKRPKSLKAVERALRDIGEESQLLPRDEATVGFTSTDVSSPSGPPETSGKNPLSPSSFPRRFGGYHLLASLGRGGMGDVCLANKSGPAGIQRLCVLKQIRFDKLDNDDYVRRFVDEARVMAQLNHANVCHVLEVGSDGDNYFLAMEHINGVTLTDLIRKHDGPLPRPISLMVMAEALEGLDYAHRHRDPRTGKPNPVVHRDISPHNIMLNFEGEVKLIDFGLATTANQTETTDPDVVMGKIAYMSPEQARGELVDGRTDMYAAAIVLTEMLLDSRFYGDRPMHAIWGLCSGGQHRPEGYETIPEEIRRVLDRALHADPGSRYADCSSFGSALLDIGVGNARGVLRDFVQESCREDMDRSWQFIQEALARAPGTEQDMPPLRSDTPNTQRTFTGSLVRERKRAVRFTGIGIAAALGLGAVWWAVAPEPPPEPAESDAPAVLARPEVVELSFTSDPPGANVLRGSSRTPIGITPHKMTVDKADLKQVFFVELEGHEPSRFEVVPDTSREVFAQLKKTAAALAADKPPAAADKPVRRRKPLKRRTGKTRKPKGVDRNAVADPW
jgi:serine/threonine protein kinase